MAAELNGPRLAPHSRGPARQLVVFLHGYGADGNDLIELGRVWQAAHARCGLRVAPCARTLRPGAHRPPVVSPDVSRSQ